MSLVSDVLLRDGLDPGGDRFPILTNDASLQPYAAKRRSSSTTDFSSGSSVYAR